MRRATSVITNSNWTLEEAQSTVTLKFEDRFRRRVRLTDDVGEPFLLDLQHATHLNEGDALVLEGGGLVLVHAAREDVLEISGQNASHLARLAWHIGNRHTPMEVLDDGRLRLLYDHVLEHMLQGLGASTVQANTPFSPEHGAYDSQNQTGAGHDHANTDHR